MSTKEQPATQKIKSSDRYTKTQVIEYLNSHFEFTDYDIRFKAIDGVDFGIRVYIKGNELVRDVLLGFELTDSFVKLLIKKLGKIEINGNLHWNNIGNIFSCWNGQTPCWSKD